MKLFIVVLKHGSAKSDNFRNYRLFLKITTNSENAIKSAYKMFSGYKSITYGAVGITDVIYLTPFLSKNANKE